MMQDQGRYAGDTVKLKNSQGEEVHVRHGRGTYTYANAFFQYTGDWVFGVKHGQGTLICGAKNNSGADSHSVFEGDFIHGEMSGQGSKRWADGSSYAGSFLLGEPHGTGLYLDGRGGSFEGGFLRGQREGFGVSSEPDREFEGQWYQGKKHGEGRMEWRNDGQHSNRDSGGGADAPAVTHEGNWSFDLRSGSGTESLADGSSFTGSFANDVRSGSGLFKHAPSGIEVRGEFRAGLPLLTPVCLKLRVPKPADFILGPAAALSGALTPEGLNTGRSSSREKRASKGGPLVDAASPTASGSAAGSAPKASGGSGGKPLSKKKAEEARLALEALVTYRASLTEGVVTLPSTGAELAVMDECSQVTVNPGHKLPVFYLCACTKAGVVCAPESGRVLKLTLRVAPPTPMATEEASAGSARSKATQQTAAAASAAAASAAAAAGDEDEEPPILAFCTCPGAKTLPWPPVATAAAASDDPAAAAAPPVEEESKRASSSASSASGKKKKNAASASAASSNTAAAASSASTATAAPGTPSKSVVKRRKSVLDDPPTAAADGPPPPFVCDGRCTPADQTSAAARASWCTVVTRRVERGYALLDEVWLSGACSPGLAVEIVVEDVTPTLTAAPAAFDATLSPRAAAAAAKSLPPIGSAPTSLRFSLLPSNTLKLLTAGVPPKKKKNTKKPAAAGTTPAKDKTTTSAAASKDTP